LEEEEEDDEEEISVKGKKRVVDGILWLLPLDSPPLSFSLSHIHALSLLYLQTKVDPSKYTNKTSNKKKKLSSANPGIDEIQDDIDVTGRTKKKKGVCFTSFSLYVVIY
jgi:hypothetical protein